MRIAVLGGGNGSHAAAVDLTLQGHQVSFWRRDEQAQRSLQERDNVLELIDHADRAM